jgi:hypothetical protein
LKIFSCLLRIRTVKFIDQVCPMLDPVTQDAPEKVQGLYHAAVGKLVLAGSTVACGSNQTSVTQHFEMARHARLRDFQFLRQLGYRARLLCKHVKKEKAGRFRQRRAEFGVQFSYFLA